VRAQHQPAAHRRRRAATAARVEPGEQAQRAVDARAQRGLGADGEKTAALAAGRTVHRRAQAQAFAGLHQITHAG
jgi:hypothetical protein